MSHELKVESNGETHRIALTGEELRLTELLRRQQMPLNTRCGQRGACDGCLVELRAGRLIRVSDEQTVSRDGPVLAVRGCEYRIDPDVGADIFIPHRSQLAYEPQVVSDFRINVPAGRNPLCDDDRRPLGVAIDIGTTTVALMLVNLSDGKILARAAGFNQQMRLGDDVVTRINLCMTDQTMLARLQEAVLAGTIEPLLLEALDEANREETEIGCFTIAANTIMLHLLAGVDPSPMGIAPFTPGFLEYRVMSCRDLPLKNVTHASVHLLPGAAAYIGADLSAGVFSSGLLYDDGPSVLVDLGTNGEIILKHKGRMLGCATAAGPAFEGARLESGMRAGSGAISHVRLSDISSECDIDLIGGKVKPAGMCGSAYVDFLAEGRRAGLLSPAGRFDVAGRFQPLIQQRDGNDHAFRVAYGQAKTPIVVSELDISRLLQAKAAIAAGILTLLRRADVRVEDVKTLYLAGGFGMHVNAANAVACGLLPGFRAEQIQVVGNTSLAGAYLSLLDAPILDDLSAIARKIEVVELNLDPSFEDEYIEQLAIA